MKKLLIRELAYSPLCLLCLAGGWVTYMIVRPSPELIPRAAYMMGFFLVAGVAAVVINSELRDSFGGGYRFLRTLPLTDSDVVQAKFMAALLDIAFSWLLVCISFSVLPAEPGILPLSLSYITLWSLCACIGVSLWDAFVYRFGFEKSALLLTLILLGVLLPVSLILDQVLDFPDTLGFPSLVFLVAQFQWFTWTILCVSTLFLYFGLFRVAVSLKRTRETA
jgi:hypothetical protein